MILSDKTIKKYIERELLCDNLDGDLLDDFIQPASLDLSIGNSFSKISDDIIDVKNSVRYKEIVADVYTVQPHEFLLATTEQHIVLPNNITAFVEGRSSIGRIGLFIQNAGWVDPGFEGQVTLELYNASDVPIRIWRGTRVAQLVFAFTDDSCTSYSGKYQGQIGATGSMIYKDFRKD